jgi:hypothetical protein
MLRCASSFPRLRGGRLAAYGKVRRIPHDLRALPAELFTEPSNLACFSTKDRFGFGPRMGLLQNLTKLRGFPMIPSKIKKQGGGFKP